jgi:hypothetical protein
MEATEAAHTAVAEAVLSTATRRGTLTGGHGVHHGAHHGVERVVSTNTSHYNATTPSQLRVQVRFSHTVLCMFCVSCMSFVGVCFRSSRRCSLRMTSFLYGPHCIPLLPSFSPPPALPLSPPSPPPRSRPTCTSKCGVSPSTTLSHTW